MAKKKYKIGLLEIHVQYITIEAENAGEAVEKAMDADGDLGELEYLSPSDDGIAPNDYRGVLSDEDIKTLIEINDGGCGEEVIEGLWDIYCIDEELKCSSN